MEPEDIDLARELVALDCWEWPERFGQTAPDLPALNLRLRKSRRIMYGDAPLGDVDDGHVVLDIAHPLTKGWLLHLARKVWGSGFVTVGNFDGMAWAGTPPPGLWFVTVGDLTFYGDTEHVAIVAAIKAGVEG